MRRSVCITEPKIALAGNPSTVKFVYIPASEIPAGSLILFDMDSKGREIDWEIPEAGSKKKSNVIWMELPGGKSIKGSAVEDEEQDLLSAFEFELPSKIEAGDELCIFVGTPELEKSDKLGTRAQQFIQRRRPFYLYIDPKGKGDYKDPEIFHLDIRGNELESIQLIAPSVVSKNQRFDVIVRFEDAYGNLTGLADREALIELTYDQLRENLNWKLFIPETGFITLPNLYFNEPGTYKLKLTNTSTDEVFYSHPIKCFSESEDHLFWGLLHGESERFDALENIESALRSFRDDKALQFFGTSPFESEEEVTQDEWKNIISHITDFNEAERFVTFLGFQWEGESGEEGVRQILYSKDSKQVMRKKDSKSNALKKIYKAHTSKDFISIPSFSMGSGHSFDFKDYSPDYEGVVEIYNSWGSSECTKAEGNPRPILSPSKNAINEAKEGSIRDALNRGLRFGFTAGGLDDRGLYTALFDSDQEQYSAGLTAISATEHSRDSLFKALQARSCYATTGERIIINFSIASSPMGSALSIEQKPGLQYNRHIEFYIAGTTDLKEIQVIRNGKVFQTIKPDSYYIEQSIDDTDPLDSIALPGEPDFAYYYLRVEQKDGHLAWSSPIWVECDGESAPAKRGRKKST